MNLFKTMTWNQLMSLVGIAAVSTLIGTGTIDSSTGLPYLTGLLGLSITMKESPIVPPPAPPAA